MAGNLKPNVPELAKEVKATLLGGSLTAGIPNGLFDGIQGSYNNNTAYWYSLGNYVEITFDSPVNIWRMSDKSYPYHIGALKIEKFENGQWVERNFEQTLENPPSQWSKWISDVPAGRYKFSSTGSPRMDGEWYLEYNFKPLQFYKTLRSNLESGSFNGIPFVFTEDGDLYGIKENELKSIINPTKPYTQNILFNGDITTDNTGQLSMDINDYDLLYFHLQGSGDKRSLMPDDMDSNSEQGYNLTASSVLKSSISDIYGMFNYGRNGGYPFGWYTEHGLPMPQWFMVEFPSPVTLNIWDYQTYYSDRRRPTVVSVQGSNDGIIFDDILTNYDVGAKGNATNHFIVKFKNNKKYKFYKMIINERDEKFEPEYGLAILTTYLYEEIKDNDNSSYLIPKELFNKNISSFNFANLSLSNTSLNITNVKKPFNLQIIGVKKGV